MSTNNDSTQHVQIAVADPTPLGLFGLAVVTMVASAQKLGFAVGSFLRILRPAVGWLF